MWGSLISCAPVGNPALKRVTNPPQDDILPHSQTAISSLLGKY